MKRLIYKFIFFTILKWKIQGDGSPEFKKSVFIAVPHTSWHDFFLGIFSRGILKLQINFVAKKELFKFPFGLYFKWMGGAPLDRNGNQNMVNSIVEVYENNEVFRLCIAPEGTRKKVTHFKTGFYYIATQLQIPIIAVAFDYRNRVVIFHPPFFPTGNIEADMPQIENIFNGVIGKIPHYSFTPQI